MSIGAREQAAATAFGCSIEPEPPCWVLWKARASLADLQSRGIPIPPTRAAQLQSEAQELHQELQECTCLICKSRGIPNATAQENISEENAIPAAPCWYTFLGIPPARAAQLHSEAQEAATTEGCRNCSKPWKSWKEVQEELEQAQDDLQEVQYESRKLQQDLQEVQEVHHMLKKPMAFCRKRARSEELPCERARSEDYAVHKVWTCSRCSRIEMLDHKTDTCKSWVCGNPCKTSVCEDGALGVRCVCEDGACDGNMLFNAGDTSLFGGGLKSLSMVNHDRRFFGRCSECYSMNEFQRVQQPCNERVLCAYTACLQPCKGIMIIVKLLSEINQSTHQGRTD